MSTLTLTEMTTADLIQRDKDHDFLMSILNPALPSASGEREIYLASQRLIRAELKSRQESSNPTDHA